MANIIVIDDRPVVLTGLVELIGSKPDYTVVATGNEADDILRLAASHDADLILLDLHMPGDVKAALNRLSQVNPEMRVLVFTAAECARDCIATMNAGAHGYVVKGSSAPELFHAMSLVLKGTEYISSCLATKVIHAMKESRTSHTKNEPVILTHREEQVAAQLMAGATNRVIAKTLNLSENTVKFYMSQIMQKLSVQNRVEVVLALQELNQRHA